MLNIPVRIRRESKQVEKSQLHWAEKVVYTALFGMEENLEGSNVKRDVADFIKNAIKKYETATYRLRNKIFRRNWKNSSAVECILNLSANLICTESDGEACRECQFKREMIRMELKMNECDKGSTSKERKEAKINDAEFAFESCADLVLDKSYEVRVYTLNPELIIVLAERLGMDQIG